MHIHDATEQAYKNGYEKGVKDFAERLKSKNVQKVVGLYTSNELMKPKKN